MRLKINRIAERYSHRSCEGRVNDSLFWMISRALDLIVIEWKFAGKRAIQTGFTEGRPYVLHHNLSASIILANPRYSRIYFLQS